MCDIYILNAYPRQGASLIAWLQWRLTVNDYIARISGLPDIMDRMLAGVLTVYIVPLNGLLFQYIAFSCSCWKIVRFQYNTLMIMLSNALGGVKRMLNLE